MSILALKDVHISICTINIQHTCLTYFNIRTSICTCGVKPDTTSEHSVSVFRSIARGAVTTAFYLTPCLLLHLLRCTYFSSTPGLPPAARALRHVPPSVSPELVEFGVLGTGDTQERLAKGSATCPLKPFREAVAWPRLGASPAPHPWPTAPLQILRGLQWRYALQAGWSRHVHFTLAVQAGLTAFWCMGVCISRLQNSSKL